jgi:hypothetical protein
VRLLFIESPQALASGLCTIRALGPFSGNRPWRGSSLKVGSHEGYNQRERLLKSVGALAQRGGKGVGESRNNRQMIGTPRRTGGSVYAGFREESRNTPVVPVSAS